MLGTWCRPANGPVPAMVAASASAIGYGRSSAFANASTSGKFSFSGLPAGEYRLAAVTDVESGQWFDPAFLEQLQAASIPVTLVEGQARTQDLRVASR